MDEGDENKGRIARRSRRSSILKLPLAGIDPNKQKEKKEIKRRSSKRVSFAETLDVWEFNKESQSENSDKNCFRNKDDNAKEISGIDSLLTGEIKNPAPVIENVSDLEDSCFEGETATLNCSLYKSPEKEFIAIANKENINIVVPRSDFDPNCGDVSPANQSMYCSPDSDNTPQKLDDKSAEDSPVVTIAARRSMSTKMFLDSLQCSFSDGLLGSKDALPDSSMETSASGSPALDKSLYYTESPQNADTTIYFNRNADQTASMDFTICNSKVFSDSFQIDSPAEKKETHVNSPPNDDMTVYFGQNLTQFANMDLTSCHGRLLPDKSTIDHHDDSSDQKMNAPMDMTRIFDETEDVMANMELTTVQDPFPFIDFTRKPIVLKKIVTEDGKENVPPSVSPYSVDINQDRSFKQMDRLHSVDMSCEDVPMEDVSCSEIKSQSLNKVTEKLQENSALNPDEEKSKTLKSAIKDMTERSASSVSFMASQIPDAEKIGLTNSVKKPGKKRVSFMCPEEYPANESSLLDKDEPPIKKLNSGNQDDLYKQNSGSNNGPPAMPVKDLIDSIDEAVLSKKNSTKSGVKRVSFYDPEEVLSKNSGSDTYNEPPMANISVTKPSTEKFESTDSVSRRAATDHLDQSSSKRIMLENEMNQINIKSKAVDLEKSSSLKASFPESIQANSNLESDAYSQQTASSDKKLGSMKSLYLSLNTSGILKSFVDSSKSESMLEDPPKSAGKQVSFLTANGETQKPKVSLSSQSQAVKSYFDNRSESPNGLNKSGAVKILSIAESGSVEKDLTKTTEKRVSFLSMDEKPLEKKSSVVKSANTDPQSTAGPEERDGCSSVNLNSSGILKSVVNMKNADRPIGTTLTNNLEKQVTFHPADEQLSEKNTMDIMKSVGDLLKENPEDSKYRHMSLNSSGIMKSLGGDENCPPVYSMGHEDLNKSAKKSVSSRSADDEPSSQKSDGAENKLPTSASISAKRPFEAPESNSSSPNTEIDNKYLYISLNNSGIIKSLGSDENSPPVQPVDHKDSNKSTKKSVSFRSAVDEPSCSKSAQNQLPSSVALLTKRLFVAPEPSDSSPDPELLDNEPTLNRLKKGNSPQGEKMPLSNPVIQDGTGQKDKRINVHVIESVKQHDIDCNADHIGSDEIKKPEGSAAKSASLAKTSKSSWQEMFSIQNVMKNLNRNRNRAIPAAPCEPTTKTTALSALNMMRPTVSVPDKESAANEIKEKTTQNTYRNVISSQLSSQDVKVGKTSPPKAPENTSDSREIIYDLNFKLEDLTGIMHERSDILIENSHYESTAHATQNQLSSSTVNNTRPSFSNKSVDDIKSSLLALSSINSTLCSRMLLNMHMPSLEKNLSSIEVDSIEDLLLMVGIDKLENLTIDYRRTSEDLCPIGFENKTLGERLLMSCLDQPKYQSILQAYDSLKSKEHNLLTEFHSQSLLENFQSALKKTEESKSNDEVKNQLMEDFKKCKQLAQRGKKQRKAERYENLCRVLRGKLVGLEEAKSELDNISQTLDQQLEDLDKALDSCDKELHLLDSLPQVQDEDLEQYVRVREYLDDVGIIESREQKLSNRCSQLRDQEKSLKEEYSSLQVRHSNLSKPLSLDTSAFLNNCQKLKMYSVILPWKVWQLNDDQQKYNFWHDTFQICIHTQEKHIKKAHFELDENWQSVAKYHPWLRIANELRQNALKEESFLGTLRHISQLPQLLHRIGNLLNSLQDLAKEIHAVNLRKVITRQENSVLVTYCCLLSKIQVCFKFDPSNYPTGAISHQIKINYGNVRCQDISRRLQRVKSGAQYLSRLVNAVDLESVSSPLW